MFWEVVIIWLFAICKHEILYVFTSSTELKDQLALINQPFDFTITVDSFEISQGISLFLSVDANLPGWMNEESIPEVTGVFRADGTSCRGELIDGFLYIASREGGLRVYDVSNPYEAYLYSSFQTDDCLYNDVKVLGSYAYMSNDKKGIHIIDITTPEPSLVGELYIPEMGSKPACAIAVDLDEDYLYVQNEGSVFVVVNITNKASPVKIGIFQRDSNKYCFLYNAPQGEYLLTNRQSTTDNYLQRINVTDKVYPSYVDDSNFVSFFDPRDIALSDDGNWVYLVGDDNYGTLGILSIYNIADIDNPQFCHSNSTIVAAEPYGIDVVGNYTFFVDSQERLITMTTIHGCSETPKLTSIKLTNDYTQSTFNNLCYVKSDGNFTYVFGSYEGVLVLDHQDKSNPIPIKILPAGRQTQYRVKVDGDFAFVALYSSPAFYVYNISDSSQNPKLVSSYFEGLTSTNPNYDMDVRGNYLYICTWQYGLIIYDIGDIKRPKKMSMRKPGADTCRGIFVEDDLLYYSSDDDGLFIFDTTNKSNPLEIGSGYYSSGVRYHGIYVKDNYAYIANWENGMDILNVENKASPVFVSNCEDEVVAEYLDRISVVGDYAFLSRNIQGGLRVISISDPTSPQILGKYEGESRTYDIAVVGNVAFLAEENGITLVDVSYKTNPQKIITMSPNPVANTYGVCAYGDHLYTVDESSFRVYKFGDIRLYGMPINFPDDCEDIQVRVEASDAVGGVEEQNFIIKVRKEGYIDEDCTIYSCNGIPTSDGENICGGHGNCSLPNPETYCSCEEHLSYYGENCNITICNGVYSNGSLVGNNGTGTVNTHQNLSVVCSGHGDCFWFEHCECSRGYYSKDCSKITNCGGIDGTNINVCNGIGDCVFSSGRSICNCENAVGYKVSEDGYSCVVESEIGDQGGVSVASWLVPILVFVFVIFPSCCCGILIVCVVLVIVVFFCSLFVVGCLGICGGGGGGIVLFNKFSTTKFDQFDEAMKDGQMGDGAQIKINKKLFEINYENLKVIKEIGSGGSSSHIFHCKWKEKDVAFKCFQTSMLFGCQENYNEFEREVEVMSSVRHPHILDFYGCCLHPPRVGIVMEFCDYGDLKHYLSKSNPDFPNKERFRVLYQTCDAMDYLHDRKVIHRDLKCENVLMTSRLEAKIIDFGLSRIFNRLSVEKTKKIGTVFYMAPEIVLGNDYGLSCDVFSFSIICWEVLSNSFDPFPDDFNIEYKIANDESFRPDVSKIDERVRKSYPEVIQAIQNSWKKDAESRPTFLDLKKLFSVAFEKQEN